MTEGRAALARAVTGVVGCAAGLAVACSSPEAPRCTARNDDGAGVAAPTAATTFVAFAGHFQGYQRWTATPGIPNPDFGTAVTGTVHDLGPMTVYVNRPPTAGAAAFPVGTIVVKEATTGPLGERTVFAMVKRGGGFNDTGALGWEWFELVNGCDGVQIVWRGVGPPAGEKYGGDAASGCNACHAMGKGNDFVLTKGLRL